MGRKLFLLLVAGTGFLLGSKAGRKPYEQFMALMRRTRETKVVSRPIESVATGAANFVRKGGTDVTDRMADKTYRLIVGDHPVVTATISDVPANDPSLDRL